MPPRSIQVLAATIAMLSLGAPSWAGPPGSCLNCSIPRHIVLVGTSGGVPASGFGAFHVVIRDLANNPLQGAVVTVDLSSAPDLTLCADQLDPNLTVDCANRRVSATTDAAGQAFFTLLGGSNGAGNATSGTFNGLIYANGTLAGSPTVSAYDLDGVNGVSGNDVSAWITDFAASPTVYGRSDYDDSGAIGGNDLSLWLKAFASATQTASCAASCP